MFTKLFLLLLIFSTSALATSVPTPVIATTQGAGSGISTSSSTSNITDPDPTKCTGTLSRLITLEASANCTADLIYPLASDGVASYQVPTNTRFIAERKCVNSATPVGSSMQFMSSTSTFADGATAPTIGAGGKYQFGVVGASGNHYGFPILTANVPYCEDYPYVWAALSFPGVQCAVSNREYAWVVGRTCSP